MIGDFLFGMYLSVGAGAIALCFYAALRARRGRRSREDWRMRTHLLNLEAMARQRGILQ